MRYPSLSIARRYLFSRKSTRAINVISMITSLAMAVGAGALIIVLSTFNGFEDLVKSLYKVFYTDLIVLPTEGKFFTVDDELIAQLEETEGVYAYSKILEENVLAEYQSKQYIVTMKGVDENYYKVVDELDQHLFSGGTELYYNEMPATVLGAGIAYTLGINLSLPNSVLTLYMPRSDKTALNDVANAFRTEQIFAGGIFSVQQDFDNKYIIVPKDFAENLMNTYDQASSIDIKLDEKAQVSKVKEALSRQLGDGYMIKTRFEQNATLYKVMQTEKWVVFAILSFIVLIAAFNIISSLSMLVIEKKQDIATLRALGADQKMIRNIFLLEGLLISLLGAFIGLLIGTAVCVGQIYFGWIKMPGTSFMIQSYPVKMMWQDFAIIFVVIVLISVLMSWLPSHRAVRQMKSLIPGKME